MSKKEDIKELLSKAMKDKVDTPEQIVTPVKRKRDKDDEVFFNFSIKKEMKEYLAVKSAQENKNIKDIINECLFSFYKEDLEKYKKLKNGL